MTTQFEELTLEHGVRAVRLSNPQISVTILPDKGADIYSLVHRASGVDVLWKSPLGLRAPGQGRFSSDSQVAWLEIYEGGWQECFPNGGDPIMYKGVELSFHGESSLAVWQYNVVTQNDSELVVDFTTQLYRSPFLMRRRMSLKADTATLTLSEQITNLAAEPMDFMWGHHPAYGAPFLSEHTRLNTNAQTILSDGSEDAPQNPLLAGKKSVWPMATGKNGPYDLRVTPGENEKHLMMAYLMDFDGTPWYTLTNDQLKVGVGCAWSINAFRCLWFWREMHGSTGFPFYGRTYTMALEPWSSYPGQGLLKVMETTKTHHTLQPNESISGELAITLFEPKGEVKRVEPDGTVVL
jgi:galactose mutarotase-like enzyme